MVIKQRAMLEEDKQLRRQAILAAAAALLAQHPERLPSVEDVARQSGLAKGTMYLYFRTREEIYLAVHEQQPTSSSKPSKRCWRVNGAGPA